MLLQDSGQSPGAPPSALCSALSLFFAAICGVVRHTHNMPLLQYTYHTELGAVLGVCVGCGAVGSPLAKPAHEHSLTRCLSRAQTPLLQDFCRTNLGASSSSVCAVPGYQQAFSGVGGGCQAVTQVDQCSMEQYYVRSSMLRALIYNQARTAVANPNPSTMSDCHPGRPVPWSRGMFARSCCACLCVSSRAHSHPATGVRRGHKCIMLCKAVLRANGRFYCHTLRTPCA